MAAGAIRIIRLLRSAGPQNGLRRWLWVLLSMGLAGWLRGQAAGGWPVEADEPLYLRVAYLYSRAICAYDFSAILRIRENIEHPPLVKLLYSVAWPCMEDQPDLLKGIRRARLIAVLFGTLAAGTLAILDPAAGILLAVHPTTIHYTSVAMLESVPLFLAILSMLAVYRSRRGGDRWFWTFVIALGITVASKYVYGVLPFLFSLQAFGKWGFRSWGIGLMSAGLLAAALNFPLWAGFPTAGLGGLVYHLQYARSGHVVRANLAWYQPVRWLCASAPESAVFLTGALGSAHQLWRRKGGIGLLLIAIMAFLLVWPTKWPHYVLIAVPLLCLSGARVLWRTSALRWLWLGIVVMSIGVDYGRLAAESASSPFTAFREIGSAVPSVPAILDGISLEEARIRHQDRQVHVVLCWRPQRPFPTGYSMFLHLLGETPHPHTGSPIWDQWDGPALNGAYDASLWIPGVRFCETHTLRLPSFAPPGQYMLTTGWYNWESGLRVPVRSGLMDPRYPDALVLDRWDIP